VVGLLAPLAAGATLVLCAHVDADALVRRADAERVTATLGVSLPGIRTL
jgi:acyl-CoA synthetase (AMP-forming)/AMP-acid ligase II